MVIDGAGDILWRKGRPQEPGTFDPPITINPGHPSRDIVAVDTTKALCSPVWTPPTRDLVVRLARRHLRPDRFAPHRFAPAQIVTANLNGDGWEDLVVRNAGDGTLSVFFNNGPGSDGPAPPPSSPR